MTSLLLFKRYPVSPNKVVETLCNRLPRTFADIVVNSVIARVASYMGFHKITLAGYNVSAIWDAVQEYLYATTTGRVLNFLAREVTAPHPETGFQNSMQVCLKNQLPKSTSASKQNSAFFNEAPKMHSKIESDTNKIDAAENSCSRVNN